VATRLKRPWRRRTFTADVCVDDVDPGSPPTGEIFSRRGRPLALQKRTQGQRLSPEHERDLVIAVESGSRGACEELVAAFMPAIGGMARHYTHSSSVSRDELLQEGVVGLLRAAERYDPSLGTPFWAYASWWIRQAMQQLVAEVTGPVVLSDRAARRLARIKEARRDHILEHHSDPSTSELAEATELNEEQVDSLLSIERPSRGLDEPLGDGEGSTSLGELLPDPVSEDEYERVVDRLEVEDLHRLSEGLGERERTILYAHYGLGGPSKTLREIAGGLGVSIERVRQIEERALEKLREAAAGPLS
jgi:RNA polymerase sigma factor (sigma-70 family)